MLDELENGRDLMLKGALNEKVVITTKHNTYDVRNASQSNSLLVVPELLSATMTTSSDSPLKSPLTGDINKSLDRSLEDEEEQTSQAPAIEHEIVHKKVLKIFFDYLEFRQIKPRVKKVQDLLHLTLYSGPSSAFYTSSAFRHCTMLGWGVR